MSIPEFISRCDRYCEAAGVTRIWLSKRLFSDTFRIRDLSEGKSDVGVRRLDRASETLGELERDLASASASDGRDEAA